MDGTIAGIVQKFGVLGTGGEKILWAWYKLEHDFSVVRQPDYEENFYFVRKQTLIFGLNIVGGRVHDQIEWNRRHTSEINFVTSVSETNILNGNIACIIIMAMLLQKISTSYSSIHWRYINTKLNDEIPVLYLHGNGHKYFYRSSFLRQQNALEIQHEGGVRHPI